MTSGLRRAVWTVVLVVASFLITALILRVSGYSVGDVFSGIIQGAITATGASTSSIRWAIPLLLIALGVVIGFRAGFFNIGGQGQFYMGACSALAISLGWREGPAGLVILCGTLAAMLAGVLWSLFPGWLRVRFGTDEVLTTLMMSFIGALVLQYLTAGPMRNPQGTGQTAASERIPEAFRLTGGSGVSLTVLLLVAGVTVLVWLVLERTRFGLTMTLVGRNATMARWQGINVRRVGLGAFALSGALAGLAGAVELYGPAARLVTGFSPEVGFTAVVVALVGLLNVWGTVVAAIFFGGLQAAILFLPIVTDLPPPALVLLHGMVAFLVTIKFRAVRRRRAAQTEAPAG
ncbi:MAG: ABC transporter permease [bacterium]|nr:ABC transporter permease [bacterium]MXV89952.1 ABC transporter permease [Acidimicrobiia bacterium]MYC44740.1 ABC transporter permease [Acidimicrobiia bacterium]MYI19595.1 ABC transporter permease [Acidimicrobiia bacterium]